MSTINDMRLSGLRALDLHTDVFEVKEKGLETQQILGQYEEELEKQRLVDFADILEMASKTLEDNPGAVPLDTIVLAPQDPLGFCFKA